MVSSNAIKLSREDKLFTTANYAILTVILFLCAYPLWFVLIASFSDYTYVNQGKVWFFPKGFTLEGYKKIMDYDRIWLGYRNSLLYTTVGTILNVIITVITGYVLSRKDLKGRNIFTYVMSFTMIFHGGLIPTYLVVRQLGMINTMWALIIPNVMGVWNVIVCRTFFQSTVPDELLESARMDGCTNSRFFASIVVPLSGAIIAVMVLFYAVAHWNTFFAAFIYLRDETKFPLQIILREIIIQSDTEQMMSSEMANTDFDESDLIQISEIIKYGAVIVASIPVLIMYPFAQKFFVKGVMIGAIKG